jgi:hypothetical protein
MRAYKSLQKRLILDAKSIYFWVSKGWVLEKDPFLAPLSQTRFLAEITNIKLLQCVKIK